MPKTLSKFMLCFLAVALCPLVAEATSWNWNLSGSSELLGTGTFSACESTTHTALSGTYTRSGSGFVHMTQTSCQTCSDTSCSSSCSNGGGECGGIATNLYAIESPQQHLIVQPVLSSPTVETQPIYNTFSGSCPTSALTSNFVFSQWSSSNDTSSSSQIGSGTFSWQTDNTATVNSGYNLTGFSSLGLTFPLSNTGCSGGKIIINGAAGSDRAGTIYITSQGEFFYQTSGNHAVYGFPQVSIGSAKRLLGNYSGFVFDASGSNSVVPLAQMVLDTNATSISGYKMLTDSTVDSTFQRTFTISQIDSPVTGQMKGTVSDGTNSGNMVCEVSVNVSSHNHIFCAGQKPGTAATPYTMLLISSASWTWLGGGDNNLTGQYGTKGVASTANLPTPRQSPSITTDSHGNAWIFGGAVVSQGFNDLWKTDGTNWTWVSGSTSRDQGGTYGAQGVASSTNMPGGRYGQAMWTDSNNHIWVFGGWDAAWGYYNDLWMYDGTNWTWVNGSSGNSQYGTYGTLGVAASTNSPGARYAPAYWTDKQGNFWLFGGKGYANGSNNYLNDLWKFDGTNWTWVAGASTVSAPAVYGTQGVASSSNTPGSTFFPAWAVDSQGNAWMTGSGTNDLWKFDGTNWTWMWGSQGGAASYGTIGMPSAANAPPAQTGAVAWFDSNNNFWMFGGYGGNNSLWKYDGNMWTWVSGGSSGNQKGAYGTLGSPSYTSQPGGRYGGVLWLSPTGYPYIFGGLGFLPTTSGTLSTYLNDFWTMNSFY